MKKYFIILCAFVLIGCGTIATQSLDGRTLTINGSGTATFENGAKIEGSPSLFKTIKNLISKIFQGASKKIELGN